MQLAAFRRTRRNAVARTCECDEGWTFDFGGSVKSPTRTGPVTASICDHKLARLKVDSGVAAWGKALKSDTGTWAHHYDVFIICRQPELVVFMNIKFNA